MQDEKFVIKTALNCISPPKSVETKSSEESDFIWR